MSSPTEKFDSDAYAQSTAQVADGSMPMLRMAAGTLIVNPEATVVLGSGKSGAVRIVANSAGIAQSKPLLSVPTGVNLSPGQLATLFTSTGLVDIVMADTLTVKAVVTLLASSSDPKDKRVARVVGYLSKQPVISQCSVLTTALAMKFWTPGGPKHSGDLVMWSRAFGLTGEKHRFSHLDDLMSFARVGQSHIVNRSQLRESSLDVTKALLRGKRGRVDAFEALQQHNEKWASVEGSDPHLYKRGLLIGSTAQVIPIRRDGVRLISDVSTPFKLRPGSEITVFCPDSAPSSLTQARLEHMDFNADTGRLGVELGPLTSKRLSRTQRTLHTNTWELLCRRTNFGRSDLFAISTPYMGGSGWSINRRGQGATANTPVAPVREVPLDVALAAAAD